MVRRSFPPLLTGQDRPHCAEPVPGKSPLVRWWCMPPACPGLSPSPSCGLRSHAPLSFPPVAAPCSATAAGQRHRGLGHCPLQDLNAAKPRGQSMKRTVSGRYIPHLLARPGSEQHLGASGHLGFATAPMGPQRQRRERDKEAQRRGQDHQPVLPAGRLAVNRGQTKVARPARPPEAGFDRRRRS